MIQESLITAAKLASINAYAPKSNIQVGCILKIEPGEQGKGGIITGVNIETHGTDTVHAEVCAVAHALTRGYRMHDVVSLTLWFPKYAQPPCGACCQFLSNFFKDDFPLICAGPDGVIETTLGECLPYAYKGRKR